MNGLTSAFYSVLYNVFPQDSEEAIEMLIDGCQWEEALRLVRKRFLACLLSNVCCAFHLFSMVQGSR